MVCGHGFAGITACRELAEEGKKVYLVEKQPEDTFNAVGNEFASLNSTILKERGVPQIDPVEFFQNWMTITGNYPNQELVMKFAQNSAETTDWYLSELTDDDFATMTTAFFPPTEHQLDEHRPASSSGRACAASTASATRPRSHGYEPRSRQARTAPSSSSPPRRDYVVMDDGAVAGLVANERRRQPQVQLQGRRHRAAAACGGNPEMMADLMPDMARSTGGAARALTSMSANDGPRRADGLLGRRAPGDHAPSPA